MSLASTPASQARPKAFYVLALLTAIYALNFLDRNVVNILLEPIKREMNLSDTMLGLLSGFGFVLFYSLVSLPLARFADRGSRRNVIALGLLLWSAMTAISGLAQNVGQLLAARSAVGIGEAAGVAPSQSLLADHFDRDERPRAMGIFATGTYIGIFLGYFVGGWVSQYYGWRAAFMVAGVPGILMALLLRLTVAEPARGLIERVPGAVAGTPQPQAAVGETARFMLGQTSYLLVIAGFCFSSVTNYAVSAWVPSLLRRIHHLSTAEIGTYAGTVKGLCGIAGAVVGGFIVAALGRRDDRWKIAAPGLCSLAAVPALVWLVAAPNAAGALWGLALSTLLVGVHVGPVFALFVTVAQVRMRALAAAAALVISNLVGLGLGPLAVGWLSDRLTPAMGDQALRYGLGLTAATSGLGGLLFLWAARYLRRDIARVGSA